MHILEKILEEIETARQTPLFRLCNYSCKDRQERIINRIGNIIRSHMDDNEWIACEERLPQEKENPITMDFYEYQVTFECDGVRDVRHYKFGKGHWWNGAGIMDKYVTAWRENPEPYRKEGRKAIMIMTGEELNKKLNFLGMERGIRELAMKDKLAPAEELATLSTSEICNLIADRYEVVYWETDELGLVKKERVPEYNDIVYVISG